MRGNTRSDTGRLGVGTGTGCVPERPEGTAGANVLTGRGAVGVGRIGGVVVEGEEGGKEGIVVVDVVLCGGVLGTGGGLEVGGVETVLLLVLEVTLLLLVAAALLGVLLLFVVVEAVLLLLLFVN